MIIMAAEPRDLTRLLAFREEAAAWLRALGSDQWSRPYPADKLLTTIEAGRVFMLRDGRTTAATITLTPDAEAGLWSDSELTEPSMFVNKLTVAREYSRPKSWWSPARLGRRSCTPRGRRVASAGRLDHE